MSCENHRKAPASLNKFLQGGSAFENLISKAHPRSDTPAPSEVEEVADAAQKELEADRDRRALDRAYAGKAAPIQRWWFQRALSAVVLTIALSQFAGKMNTGIHHGHEEQEETHDVLAEQYAALAEHHESMAALHEMLGEDAHDHEAQALGEDGHHHGGQALINTAHKKAKHLASLGIDMHGNIWGLQWMLLIVVTLMLATVAFEEFRDWLEESFSRYQMVLGHIWAEFTVLGFLALCTFVLIQGGVLPTLSVLAFGDAEHLVHLFEALHFALFFVMIGFLFMSLWLLVAVAATEQQQNTFDATINYYRNVAGTNKHSLASVLGLQSNRPKSRLGQDYGASLVESELAAAEATKAAQERTWSGRMRAAILGDWDVFDRCSWELMYTHRLAAYQRLRHRFIVAPADFGKEPLPPNFEFSEYLLRCVQGQLAQIMSLGPTVWWRAIGLVIVICEVTAFATEISPTLAQVMLIVAGWILLFQACVVEQHYIWVLEQLIPVTQVDKAQEEIARIRRAAPLWRPIHDFLHSFHLSRSRTHSPVVDDPEDGKESASKWQSMPNLLKDVVNPAKMMDNAKDRAKEMGEMVIAPQKMVHSAKGKAIEVGEKVGSHAKATLRKAKTTLSVQDILEHENSWSMDSLAPGEYMRRKDLGHGECKHTSLFFIRHPIKPSREIDLYAMKLSAQRPAQLWVQTMLLLASLQITIVCVFLQPESRFDPKIILGLLPAVIMMLFQVPDTLEPMVMALSIEMLTDHQAVQQVMYDAKVRRFAHAAKLLQAFRSQARRLQKQGKAARRMGEVPKNMMELMKMLPVSKKKQVVQLKEAFDLFDVSGDGALTIDELRQLMVLNGVQLSQHEAQMMVEEIDPDGGDGAIQFVEFAFYMVSKDTMSPEEAADIIFDHIDIDHNGVLSTWELKRAFENLHTGLDEEELMDIISMFDIGHTGRLFKSEFVAKLAQVFEENALH